MNRLNRMTGLLTPLRNTATTSLALLVASGMFTATQTLAQEAVDGAEAPIAAPPPPESDSSDGDGTVGAYDDADEGSGSAEATAPPAASAVADDDKKASPPNKLMRDVIKDVCARVETGDNFSQALAKHPKIFNRLFTCMVEAGEKGGLLAEILARLATYLENTARLRKKVKSAMMYPVTVTVIVFPRFAAVGLKVLAVAPVMAMPLARHWYRRVTGAGPQVRGTAESVDPTLAVPLMVGTGAVSVAGMDA